MTDENKWLSPLLRVRDAMLLNASAVCISGSAESYIRDTVKSEITSFPRVSNRVLSLLDKVEKIGV